MKEFMTFGTDHKDKDGKSLFKHYLVIEGRDSNHIRDIAFAIRGPAFCIMNRWADIQATRERHGLTEVSLEQCTITDITIDELNELLDVSEDVLPQNEDGESGFVSAEEALAPKVCQKCLEKLEECDCLEASDSQPAPSESSPSLQDGPTGTELDSGQDKPAIDNSDALNPSTDATPDNGGLNI